MVEYCKECEAPVSKRFTRVFGSKDNEVYACLRCTTSGEIFNGAAAGIES